MNRPFQVHNDARRYFLSSLRIRSLYTFSPLSARMQRIPRWFHLAAPGFSLIMVAEAINADVPYGLEFLDKQRFAQRNPNIIVQEIAASKIS
jgi:hypothetical protein